MKDKMQNILDNFNGTYRQTIKEHVLHLLQQGVENETKKNDYNFKPEDIDDLVNFLTENLQKQVVILSGKKASQILTADMGSSERHVHQISINVLSSLALALLGLAQRGCWYVRVKRWSVALLCVLLVRAR